jgi:hypothetical protein
MQPLPPRPFTPFDYALPAGRGIHAIISPLPRSKRAKAPAPGEPPALPASPPATMRVANHPPIRPVPIEWAASAPPGEPKASGFQNNPFAQLEINR